MRVSCITLYSTIIQALQQAFLQQIIQLCLIERHMCVSLTGQ